MKKVDREAAQRLINGKPGVVSSNTEVVEIPLLESQTHRDGHKRASQRTYELRIFGNGIAQFEVTTGTLAIRNCGHESFTTKNRLNAVLSLLGRGRPIYQKDWEWYYGDCDFYKVAGRHEYKIIRSLGSS